MGLSALKKELKTLLIFAPAHKMYFEGISLSGFDFWQTPLGNVEIDKKINEELKEFGFINDEAFIQEHSVEIQLPLIKTIFDNVKIVPILIGKADYKTVSKIIEKYYDNEDLGFIISSDLSHFLTYDEAKRVDNLTSSLIENLDIENFKPEFACNSIGIKGLIDFAKTKNWPLIVSGLYNSGDVTGETNRVVGYGAWALYEGNLNSFIKKYYSNFILSLCKLSIKSAYEPIKEKIEVPLIMKQKGASFVTLEKNGQLRGCIGSIGAYRPLIEDIISNAQNAAFKDPRFYPVQKEEIEELQIAVSLLSNPVPIDFKDEDDLLNQLIKDVDGLIIKDKEAIYLSHPLILNVELTDVCPLSCPYCYKDLSNTKELDYSVLVKVVSAFRKNGGSTIMQSAPEASIRFAHFVADSVEWRVLEMTAGASFAWQTSTVTGINASSSSRSNL